MNRRSILAAYKKKSSHFQTGVTGFKSGNLFSLGASSPRRRGAHPVKYRPKFPTFWLFFTNATFAYQGSCYIHFTAFVSPAAPHR